MTALILEISEEDLKDGKWNSIFSNPVVLAMKKARSCPRASYFNGTLKIANSVYEAGEVAFLPSPYEFLSPRVIKLIFTPVKQWDWRYNWSTSSKTWNDSP